MIEKAKDILEYLSKEPDARELARLRQEAQVWYRMDLEEERRLGREEGRTLGQQEGFTDGEAKGRINGINEGAVQASRRSLLMLLEGRNIALDDEQRQKIESCDDTAQLDQWFRDALSAQNAQQIFG